jgi:endo-1,3-1,4-beta-glycanase ExoK
MVDYAFEWTPETIRWFVNGRPVHAVERASGNNIPTTSGKLYLSIWSGQGADSRAWLGTFDYPGRPLVATIERIAFTRLGDRCQFPESIVCARR